MTVSIFQNRSGLLDCIRAIAVTMVVLFHVASRYDVAELDIVARQFMRFGFLGVDIFYPLSGFLITRFLLSHTEPGSIRAFFLRRVFRIIPLYMVAVTLFLVASIATGFDAAVVDKIWVTYFFLTGWFAFVTGPDSVPYTITWSLSVEEFAYILFGVTAWLFRGSFRWMLVFLAVAPIVLRIYLNANGYENIYYFPPARLDSIATGGLVAVLVTRIPNLWVWTAGGGLLAALTWKTGGALGATALFTMVTLATCTAIALCETVLRNVRSVVIDQVAKVGLYSYFIYLFHFFNLYGLFLLIGKLPIPTPSFWVMSAICMAVTYVQAYVSFNYFEGPLMVRGRKLENRSRAQAGVARAGGN